MLCLSEPIWKLYHRGTGISLGVKDLMAVFISSFLTSLEPQQLVLRDVFFFFFKLLLLKVNCNNWSGIIELLIAEMAGFYRKQRQIQRVRKTCFLCTHYSLSFLFFLPLSPPFIPLIKFYSALLKACCDSFKAFGLQSGGKTMES